METLKEQLATSTVNRYGDSKTREPWRPEHELFYLSEKILEWYYNDELGIIIIHGQQGYGKSTYGAISCAEVYGHDIDNARFFYNWEAVKKHIVWTPRQFIELCKEKKKLKEKGIQVKEPFLLWDDAGFWLNSMNFRDKLCIDVGKYMEIARSHWGAIVFTVSDQKQILSKIRGIPHAWSVPIHKATTPKRGKPKYKWTKDRRYARLHKSWCSEDLKRSGKKGQECDIFYARMPGNYNFAKPRWMGFNKPKNTGLTWGFYGWYKPWRDEFCDHAVSELDDDATRIGL